MRRISEVTNTLPNHLQNHIYIVQYFVHFYSSLITCRRLSTGE